MKTKTLLTIVMAVTLSILLSGCSLFPQRDPVERIVYRYIRVPTEMTEKVAITAPPEPVYYSKLIWDKQEELLFGLTQAQMTQINICNARLESISAWNLKQLKIYEPVSPLLHASDAP